MKQKAEIVPASEQDLAVLAELAEIAFADLGAEPAPPVKVGDKLRALELIYKYLGLGDGAAAEEPVVIVDEAPTEQEVTP